MTATLKRELGGCGELFSKLALRSSDPLAAR
jgi:hypothetical protein